MDVQLIAAGSLAVLGAAIHGAGGEVLVVRKLPQAALPASVFGGPRMTMAMIHVTWHLTTFAFLAVGVALLLSGTVIEGDASHGIALVAACTTTGFAVLVLAFGAAYMRSPRTLLRHPAPALMAVTAALALWGTL